MVAPNRVDGTVFLVSFGCTVPFLDVLVYVKNLTWHTRLFCKPTDLHAFLHTSSFHPAHVVKNIPFSVALRIRRICSEHSVYWDTALDFIYIYLARRGYCTESVRKAFYNMGLRPRVPLLLKRPRKTISPDVTHLIFPLFKEGQSGRRPNASP
jgi:hypothetical protein